MKTLKLALTAGLMAVATILGALTPNIASADDFNRETTLVISNAQARFEATPLNYDASTNKLQYHFSWLQPARSTYSFSIDGKLYQGRVTKNGSLDTAFWFSPSITYSIQIYSAANGKGRLVGEGTFTAPNILPTQTVTKTKEEEYGIVLQYIQESPDLPKTFMSSPNDVTAIKALITSLDSSGFSKFSDGISSMSNKSIEMLAETPLVLADIDSQDNSNSQPVGQGTIKIYKGGQYGIWKYKVRDLTTKKIENLLIVFIKEDGKWKIDFVQTVKLQIQAQNK